MASPFLFRLHLLIKEVLIWKQTSCPLMTASEGLTGVFMSHSVKGGDCCRFVSLVWVSVQSLCLKVVCLKCHRCIKNIHAKFWLYLGKFFIKHFLNPHREARESPKLKILALRLCVTFHPKFRLSLKRLVDDHTWRQFGLNTTNGKNMDEGETVSSHLKMQDTLLQ